MKWLECNVILNDYSRFNEMLEVLVKPYVKSLYSELSSDFSWHYFREPSLCWRIYAWENEIEWIRDWLDTRLLKLEKNQPDLFKWHYFGAFLIKDREYTGEQELYGTDAWGLCYKRWEAGSNLALQLCTTEPQKSLPFHYTRDIHLFENQLGFELSDEITIILKWAKRLMECDGYYTKWLDEIDAITKETWQESKIKGI